MYLPALLATLFYVELIANAEALWPNHPVARVLVNVVIIT
jgi:hypothetical protein